MTIIACDKASRNDLRIIYLTSATWKPWLKLHIVYNVVSTNNIVTSFE